jgi:Tfp pilus assembly protein PilF
VLVLAGVTRGSAQESSEPARSAPSTETPSAALEAPPIPAAVDDARAALRAGELDRALSLARRALQASPESVDALTVLGMVEAERGEPQDALRHFDAALALAGQTPPAGLSWNRAACLSALGRAEAAERAFLEVAGRAKPPLDALGLINAGLAALDAEAPARARTHLAQAEQRDREGALELELQQLRDELDAHDHGEREERERLRELVERGQLDQAERAIARELRAHPDDAELSYLGGLVAYQQARLTFAEARLTRARELGLDHERDALARDYLELLAGGLWLSGHGLYLDAELGGGYDSNAVQAGLGQGNPLLSSANDTLGGAYARAALELGYGLAPWTRGFMVARYGVEQLAYSAGALDLWNAQQHELAFELEQRLDGGLRLGALTRGSFELAGLTNLRAFAASGGAELALGLDHGGGAQARLTAGVQRTLALDADFEFLKGTRLELLLQETLSRGALRAGLFASYRTELLGTQRVATTAPLRLCSDCSASYVIPLAYHGPRGGVWGSYRVLPELRAAARITGELRSYDSAAYLELASVSFGSAKLAKRVERDLRLSLGTGLTLDLPDPFELDLDYDVTFAWSNTDNTLSGDHTLDYANRQFVRHVVALGVAIRL